MKISHKKGFGPLAIVIIVAIVLVLGGGVYYASHKAPVSEQVDSSVNANSNTNASVQTSNGTLRNLLSMGGSLMCTFDQSTATTSMTGTMYVSNGMMRGDFTMKSGTSASMDSHMIKNGDTIYAWTGAQGAKMAFNMMATTSASASSKSNVNLDQKVNYKCSNWTTDSSKFSVPTNVNFIDVSASMNAAVKAGASAGSQCSACNALYGSAKTQCLSAMHC